MAIGGEDTLGVAARLHAEHDLPVVGVPKTIDNDLSGTDYTFGFDTAVFICTEAIDRLHTTAESHNRVMVLEVMGRHTGWIAVVSGIAGGADVILIPEHPSRSRTPARRSRAGTTVARTSRSSSSRRATSSRAAATKQARSTSSGTCGSPSAASARASPARSRNGRARDARDGARPRPARRLPHPRDRVLATRYGLKAADLVDDGRFGRMAALRGDSIVDVSLEEATAKLKTVPKDWYEVARAFFG